MMKIMVGHCIIKQTLFKNGIVRESTAFNPNNKEKEFWSNISSSAIVEQAHTTIQKATYFRNTSH